MSPTPATRTLAQRLMEWDPLVRIYESRLWRRSPAFAAMAGISFENELACTSEAAHLGEGPRPVGAGALRILDLACGSGIYSRPFAAQLAGEGGRVVGLDLSLPMLAFARRAARREARGNLDLVRASAQGLPFADASFDLANCCGALHLFPDVDGVLAEVRRVLVPGGRFTVAAVRQQPGAAGRFAAALGRRIGVASFTPESLRTRFARAGLGDFACLYAARIWMIVAARKPAGSEGMEPSA